MFLFFMHVFLLSRFVWPISINKCKFENAIAGKTGTTQNPVYESTGTFSFANSYTQGDATDSTGTNTTVTAGATSALSLIHI